MSGLERTNNEIRFAVEHCAGHGVEKIGDDFGSCAVQRGRFRCCGCGLEFFLTVTMRTCPPSREEPVQELPFAGDVTAESGDVPLPRHRVRVLR